MVCNFVFYFHSLLIFFCAWRYVTYGAPMQQHKNGQTEQTTRHIPERLIKEDSMKFKNVFIYFLPIWFILELRYKKEFVFSSGKSQ